MRLASLVIGLAVMTGCREKAADKVSETPARTPTFDPDNLAVTVQWVGEKMKPVREAQKSKNEIAAEDAFKKLKNELSSFQGKSVTWRVKVSRVDWEAIVFSPYALPNLWNYKQDIEWPVL